MEPGGHLRQQERHAHAAFRRLRDVLDALPDSHPSKPVVAQAVAAAETYWLMTRDDVEAVERAIAEPDD